MSSEKPKIKLGEMLLSSGLINKNQLNIALANQREWGGRLGSILVNMGFIKEEKLAQFLSHQLNIPSIDLGSIRIKPETIELISKSLAEKNLMIPVAFQKRKGATTVLVAMADPLDLATIDEIQFSTGLKLKAGIAPEGAIWRAIQIYYYENKSVTQRHEGSREPIKIDLTDIDESLEIFRGREGEELQKYAMDGAGLDELMIEVRALRNLLVQKNIISISEFFEEVNKFKK